MKKKLRSFEELMRDSGLEVFEDREEILEASLEPIGTDLNGVAISEYEVDERAKAFLNGWRLAEETYRKLINNISFQLNRKFAEGYQAKELTRFYNESIGKLLDDFMF